MGVHSKKLPAFVFPNKLLHARGLDIEMARDDLQGGAADARSKMRPDIVDSGKDNNRTRAVFAS